MKKLTSLLLILTMILSLGTLFSFAAEEIPENANVLDSGDKPFAAYLTARNSYDTHDARVLLVANESLLMAMSTVSVTLNFTTASGTVSHSFSLGDGTFLYRSVVAAGETYTAKDGYLLFGKVVAEIPYSAWSKLTLTVTADSTEYSFALTYDQVIRKDPVNLLTSSMEETYPIGTNTHGVAIPFRYFFVDPAPMHNITITSIRVPVASCAVGDTLTVSVERWSYHDGGVGYLGFTEGAKVIATHVLTADADDVRTSPDYITLDANIEIPHGCSIFIGDPTDTMKWLFVATTTGFDTDRSMASHAPAAVEGQQDAYQIIGCTFAFDFYGYRSESFFETDSNYANASYNYAIAPFLFIENERFSNSVITSIDLPIRNAAIGQTFTVSVVKVDPNTKTIVETYKDYTLTVYQNMAIGYMNFLTEIEIPEGYTVGFGKIGDTVDALCDPNPTSFTDHHFYSGIDPTIVGTSPLGLRIYGYTCN